MSRKEDKFTKVINFVYRLLEAGGASVVSGKPPYDIASLIAGKLTHVFTERNLEPVIAGLRKAGLPCLSPDFIPEYILRVNDIHATM